MPPLVLFILRRTAAMRLFTFLVFILVLSACNSKRNALVFQTDFGLKDGAVNAMKGVVFSVDDKLPVFDLTHEIPAYEVWEASYRLYQAISFWPEGTVFVSVVDPGVGTSRKSIVAKTGSGHYIVTPDNGTLTLVQDLFGIESVRLIDEKLNRRAGSDSSYTFHGRDVYAYTGARLASGLISFEEVGPAFTDPISRLEYQKPILAGDSIKGNIPVLDIQYGNIWTNIHDSLFRKLNIGYGNNLIVTILKGEEIVYMREMPFVKTFGDVAAGQPMSYINSLMNFSIALNMGNFADSFGIRSGSHSNIVVRKASK